MKHLAILLTLLSSLYSFASNTTNFPADTTQVAHENILYKVSQDDNYVYLNISTTDKKTSMSIIRTGLSVYYDIKGKKKKGCAVYSQIYYYLFGVSDSLRLIMRLVFSFKSSILARFSHYVQRLSI